MSEQEFVQSGQQVETEHDVNSDPREQSQEYMGWEASPGMGQQGGEKLQSQPTRQKRFPFFLLLVLLAGIFLFGGFFSHSIPMMGEHGPGMSSVSLQMRTFTFTGTPNLEIRDNGGTIHIHTGQTNAVIVHPFAQGTVPWFNGPEPKVSYHMDDAAQKLTVDAAPGMPGFFFTQHVNLDITVPDNANIDATADSGSIDIQDVTGQVHAETGSGDITIHHVDGPLTLRAGSGSIHADTIQGQAILETGSGAIDVMNAGLQGQSLVRTGSGSIAFHGSIDQHGDYHFEAGSGSVDLTLPASASFNLKTSTGSGDINNAFGRDVVGSDPHPDLSVSTGSGSITIHQGD